MAGTLTDPETRLADVRSRVRDRVLWLATALVHYANHVRPNPDGSKVGGHQASSASSVAILSALFFETIDSSDRVAIKPHASPVLHAIQYLLGELEPEYMERFRDFGGLQAYPSRTKDPDTVDFSTGSVGLGGPAAAFGALVRDYLDTHGLSPESGRFYAHIGDAELDEGSMWEAVIEPALEGLSRCTWIVDVNRQSLDRVVPGIRVRQFMEMLEANGWTVLVAKYGDALSDLMARPGGHALRRRIDDMSNEEYQGLLVASHGELRQRLLDGAGSLRHDLSRCIEDVCDEELASRVANLGGHDVGLLVRTYREAAQAPGPAAVFAYTVKGWGLQSAADPRNHAALLTPEQFRQVAATMGMDPENPWARFDEKSPEAEYVGQAAKHVHRESAEPEPALAVWDTNLPIPRHASTQDVFARMLVELDKTSPEAASRIVTTSADVATSTGLSTWINRVSLWSREEEPDFLGFRERTLKWLSKPEGRHIELGLSEMNLFLLLGQLGLADRMSGRRLIPIGTVYDPFIARGMDALVNSVYQESRFMIAASPSGVTLSGEGGAHQGVITPSLGISLPGITYYEPAFGREVEWIMLECVRRMAAGEGGSYLLRLNTKAIDQSLFRGYGGRIKDDVVGGCYRYRSGDPTADALLNLFVVGPLVDEVLGAVGLLEREGISPSVFVVTSPDLLYRRLQAAEQAEQAGTGNTAWDPTGLLEEAEIGSPVLTVIDGHPHAMSFLGAALDCPSVNLGVSSFGQSGSRSALYRHFGVDAEGIFHAGLGLVDRLRRRATQAQ